MKQTVLTKIKTYSPLLLAAGIILCYLLTEGLKINEILLHDTTHVINVVMGVLIVGGLILFHFRVRKVPDKTEELIRLMLFAGLVMRIGYMLYTDAYTRPHDIAGGHDS